MQRICYWQHTVGLVCNSSFLSQDGRETEQSPGDHKCSCLQNTDGSADGNCWAVKLLESIHSVQLLNVGKCIRFDQLGSVIVPSENVRDLSHEDNRVLPVVGGCMFLATHDFLHLVGSDLGYKKKYA